MTLGDCNGTPAAGAKATFGFLSDGPTTRDPDDPLASLARSVLSGQAGGGVGPGEPDRIRGLLTGRPVAGYAASRR